ncbi:hypothetical protein [Streptomyces sp. NPDC050422]|uniref:hypothetical protein n=1 Tax=Streptomyces sp. NPDC050422 TaxID=3365614 RepID=UPI0037AEF9A8
MPDRSSNPVGASRVRRRALLGTAVLVMLVVIVGLAAHLTRDDMTASDTPATHRSSTTAPSPSASASRAPAPGSAPHALAVPPNTHNPIVFGKAAAAALWSYDTRAYSQTELLTALHGWLTTERRYADRASVDAVVPSPLLWKQMAANGQFATTTVNEGHFPEAFSRALQEDPGTITQVYVYAVTVSGKQSIAWRGSPAGGAENRVTTLAVQCRPSHPCALAGVMPSVAP